MHEKEISIKASQPLSSNAKYTHSFRIITNKISNTPKSTTLKKHRNEKIRCDTGKWFLEVRPTSDKRRGKMVRGIMYQIQLSKVPWYTVNLHPLIIFKKKKKNMSYFLCVFSQLNFSDSVFGSCFFSSYFLFAFFFTILIVFHISFCCSICLPLVCFIFLWDLLSKLLIIFDIKQGNKKMISTSKRIGGRPLVS